MQIELTQLQIELLLEALQERQWELYREAEGKFSPRPGSPRYQAGQTAQAIRRLLDEISDQVEE